jgi:hypothetical protein
VQTFKVTDFQIRYPPSFKNLISGSKERSSSKIRNYFYGSEPDKTTKSRTRTTKLRRYNVKRHPPSYSQN